MRRGAGLLIGLALVWIVPLKVVAQDSLEAVGFSVERFEVIGDNPIGNLADSILAPYIGEQYGLEGLSAARDALEQAIIHAGYNFHRVSLPPQNLFEGVVLFKVSRFGIGKILVEGNEFFDEENILNSVPELKAGETPNTKLLSRSLKIANHHSSKSTLLRFKEGEEADTIDALLVVKDRDPQVYFISLDNTGSEDAEEWRTTFGYQNGNLFNRDHAVTATLTTAPEDTDATTQIGINYHIPMYQHGASMDFLLSDSDSAGETGGEDDAGQSIAPGTGGGQALEITGQGTVIGAIYNRPLLTDGNFSHEWSVGIQHKNFDNKSEFDNTQLGGADVISVPLELGYSFNRQGPDNSFFGSVKLVQEVGDDDEEYEQDRPEAEGGWTALRFDISYDQLFADEYLFHVGFSGQQTSELLISGEQFGVGGIGTLRGFEERSVTGDSGYQLSLELWFPPLTSYQIRLLVFTDIAHTEFNDGDDVGNEGVDFDLSSAGFGLFWSWRESLSVSLNYGVIGDGGGLDTSINEDGDDKLHVSAVYRF
ncbi:MAG: ShlB/FhaC/HecB family hemolysin secretion/activation protein [Gammaproteobacteria bacterium]|nr:ShlB/FhaC/HecB family hemolysin secretion/activation protein [Gammaproteobacteria bacterium]